MIAALRIAGNLIVLAWRQAVRHRLRSGLAVAAVACGLFLATVVASMQRGLERATAAAAGDTRLVVFRDGRFCPATSRLPERYAAEIAAVPGVRAVAPTLVAVSSCGTGMDVATFRGVPAQAMPAGIADAATLAAWRGRADAAVLGPVLARRRGLAPGDGFSIAGIAGTVAGLSTSPEAQHRNVAFVHLGFLQQLTRAQGAVTQFDVVVDDPARAGEVAAAIDRRFAGEAEPTRTRPEKAFVAEAAGEVLGLVAFARWVGLAAAAAVFAVIANTLLIAVRGRSQELAVLGVLGYGPAAIAGLVMAEGLILGLAGGALGAAAAAAALHAGGFSLTSEGLSVIFAADAGLLAAAAAMAAALGLVAAAPPAWRAARLAAPDALRGA